MSKMIVSKHAQGLNYNLCAPYVKESLEYCGADPKKFQNNTLSACSKYFTLKLYLVNDMYKPGPHKVSNQCS